MGPAELEIFFKRMFAFRIPKVPRIDFRGWFLVSIDKTLVHPAPHEVLILLVLLVSWMEDPPEVQSEYDVLEFFAGVGRIARLSEKVGMKSVAYDIDYGNSRAKQSGKRSAMDLNSSAGLVLAIKLILRSSFNHCVSIFATCCSSWVPVNRGTGLRDLLVPMGNEFVVSVRKANKMVSRNLVPSELLKFSYIPWKGFFLSCFAWIPHWPFAKTKECYSHGFDDLCWWNNSFGESLQQPDRPPWQVCLDGEDIVGAWHSGFLAEKVRDFVSIMKTIYFWNSDISNRYTIHDIWFI